MQPNYLKTKENLHKNRIGITIVNSLSLENNPSFFFSFIFSNFPDNLTVPFSLKMEAFCFQRKQKNPNRFSPERIPNFVAYYRIGRPRGNQCKQAANRKVEAESRTPVGKAVGNEGSSGRVDCPP